MTAFTVKENDFDMESKNVRFIAYLKSQGLKPGDVWKSWEFMQWISNSIEEYRKHIGLSPGDRLKQEELEKYFCSIVSQEAEQLSLF